MILVSVDLAKLLLLLLLAPVVRRALLLS